MPSLSFVLLSGNTHLYKGKEIALNPSLKQLNIFVMDVIYLALLCKYQYQHQRSLLRKFLLIFYILAVGFVTAAVCSFHSEKVLRTDNQLLSKLQYKYHISTKSIILTVNYLKPGLLNQHSKKHQSLNITGKILQLPYWSL